MYLSHADADAGTKACGWRNMRAEQRIIECAPHNLNPSIIITVTQSFSGQSALMFDVIITSGDPVDKFD